MIIRPLNTHTHTTAAAFIGELKKPARSIPLGTMIAVAFVFFVYFSENLMLAGSFDR